jgi:hypothetical protein
MSTQVWIGRATCFLSFLGVANVVLADRTLRTGDVKKIRAIHRSTCNCSKLTGSKCRSRCFSAGKADITKRAAFS